MYADSDQLTEITWYWAADDAAAVDLPNIAYDRTWQFLEGHQPTMGEQLARPPYYRGVPPVDAPGRAPCGSAEAWAGLASITDGGLVLDPATGLPECCGGDVYPINTGVLLGGELEVESIEHVAGGVALGGELEVLGRADGVAIGGEIEVPGLVDGVAIGGELEIPLPPISTACCTEPIPQLLHALLTAAAVPDLDGLEVDLEFTAASAWQGEVVLPCGTVRVRIVCNSFPFWETFVLVDDVAIYGRQFLSWECGPLVIDGAMNQIATSSCNSSGGALTLTVQESPF